MNFIALAASLRNFWPSLTDLGRKRGLSCPKCLLWPRGWMCCFQCFSGKKHLCKAPSLGTDTAVHLCERGWLHGTQSGSRKVRVGGQGQHLGCAASCMERGMSLSLGGWRCLSSLLSPEFYCILCFRAVGSAHTHTAPTPDALFPFATLLMACS